MATFRDLSIRNKLIMTLMGVTAVAVLAASVAFYGFMIDHYRKAYHNDIASLANVIGSNCQASLAFDIPEDAQKTLKSLENRPSILSATIYNDKHELFASYGNTALLAPHMSHKLDELFNETHHIEKGPPGTILIHQDIIIDNQKIGCITLLDNMQSIHTFQNIALFTLAVIFIFTTLLSFLISTKLRDIISKPISDLAAVTQNVSENQDFTLRAVKYGNDEVGDLVEAFNKMLAQISERNTELQKSEQRFRALVNQAVDAFFLHDLDGNIIDVNQRACDTLGYTRHELLSMTMEDIDLTVNNLLFKDKYWKKMRPETPVSLEGTHVHKNGTKFPVETREGIMDLGNKKVILALVRDVTDRIEAEKEKVRLENQLQQAQKMESIGTLAAGIAHDFNNILSPIYGYVELARMKVGKGSELSSYLEEVHHAAHRAGELVKQILTFSRQDTEKFSQVEVHVIIKEALKLLRATIPSTIEIKQQIDPSCGYVLANPTQVHQVLMNLCTNAYHAMRDTGGTLGVSLLPKEITRRDILKNINLRPGPYILLEVSDTGSGMTPETQSRIFEPYFTTKAKGEGTGMGLSLVHGIIKSHGGNITVYSEPGKGTTIHVYLPVSKKSLSQEELSFTDDVPTGTEKILLIDDEESVIKVEGEMLKSLGYRVDAFKSPIEALEQFRANPSLYDIIITDMTMPKMTGDKLAQEILAERPDIPIIMCTGFSELINKEEALKLGIRKFVTKPIIINTFARDLREVLDTKQI